MAFFFNREKTGLKEEMRMRFCAPSFSLNEGEVLNIWTLAELKASRAQIKDRIVLLYPGLNCMLSPRQWMKELSCAYYLIICTDADEKSLRPLKKEADKVVYSLTSKTLSGVGVSHSADECRTILETIVEETGRDAVTINSTEGEFNCFQ